MSKQVIDTSGTTDTLAAGMGKVNSNFTEVYDGTQIDSLTAATAATGGTLLVRQSGNPRKMTVTAAGATLAEAADAAAQRTAMNLGGSATLAVGTTAGTVAAGDHNHSGVYSPVGHTHSEYAISTPRVYHVTTSGNDTTGDGSMVKPYLTFGKAEQVGHVAAVNFAIHLGAGSFTYTKTSAVLSPYLTYVRGAGEGFDLGSTKTVTILDIDNTPSAVTDDTPAVGFNLTRVRYDALWLRLIANGGSVTDTLDNNVIGGAAGSIILGGTAIVDIECKGGSVSAASTGTGGVGGYIVADRGLRIIAFTTAGGTGASALGADGSIAADDCDMRTLSSSTGTVTAGRCSCDSSLTITNDKGGNAIY